MIKKIYIVLVIAFFSLGLAGQDIRNYNLYNQNPILYNPAFAVNDSYFMAYANSHLQWLSFDGAPKNYDIGASMNFTNMGAAISVISNQQGLLNNLYASAKYGYQLNFGDNHYLKMGVSLGVANKRLNAANAVNVDASDPVLSGDSYTATGVTSGVGFAYRMNNIHAQLIMPQLFEYKALNLYTIGIVGYDYNINDDLKLMPSVMARGMKGSPLQFDANVGVMWKKMIMAQVAYRSSNSLIVSLGYNANNYSIGYAFQSEMNPIASGSAGSHEIQFMLRLGKKEKVIPKTNIFGTVTSNLDNKPIDAEVTILANDIEIQKLNTDPQTGNYGITLPANKTYQLKVFAAGYKPNNTIITVPKNETEYKQDFKLVSENAILTGTLLNKVNDKPVKGVITFMDGNKVIKVVNSDDKGLYSTDLKSGKTYNVKVKADNYKNYDYSVKIDDNAEEISRVDKLEPELTLSGIVTDNKTGKPISVNLEIYDNATGDKIAEAKSDANGKYIIKLNNAKSIAISAFADNYLFYSENIDIDLNNFENKKDIKLKPAETGASIVLNNVNFDTGKSILRTESYPEIDRLISVMMQNPSMKVEISGHTDNTGNSYANKKLSKSRAQAVVDYIISKGIKKNRIKAAGYGSSFPRDTNDTEEGRQNNRRVEAKILKD